MSRIVVIVPRPTVRVIHDPDLPSVGWVRIELASYRRYGFPRPRLGLEDLDLPFFSTRKFHASWRPFSICCALASANRMWVHPILPQPPGMARKTSGASAISACCNAGDSIRLPYPRCCMARVAKMWPPTRKSGAPM
jgi:hypothetical protein